MERISIIITVVGIVTTIVGIVATLVGIVVALWYPKRAIQTRFARNKPSTKPRPRKTKGVATKLLPKWALRFIECAAIVEIPFSLYDLRNSFHLLPRMTNADLFYVILLSVALAEMIFVFFLMEQSIRYGKFRR